MEASFPQSIVELDQFFPDEEACRAYLARLRWPDGFVCPRCQSQDSWQASRGRWVCRACRYQGTVTAGTIFQDTRLPLRLWFHAIWQILSQKNGASAASVRRSLGLGSYRTAWTWLHKLRRAMVLPGRVALAGQVEVDETYLGGPAAGTWGRSLAAHKQLVAIAVEKVGSGIGRICLACLTAATRQQLHDFIRQNIQPGSLICTDGLRAYRGLDQFGYQHQPVVLLGKTPDAATTLLPHVHRVASLLGRWLLGTHHSTIGREQLPYYLDEFTFRFNRRKSRTPGKLFHALLHQAVREEPAPYKSLIRDSVKPQ
jgi:transposase-like protein